MPIGLVAQVNHQQKTQKLQHYTVTDLGTLEGGTFSQPFFINRYGLVSGSSNLPDGNQHATLWLEELKVDIGAPGLGGPNSIAFGDNEVAKPWVKLKAPTRIPVVRIFAVSAPTSPVYLSCGRTRE